MSLQKRMQAGERVCRNYGHYQPSKMLVDVRELVTDLSMNNKRRLENTCRGILGWQTQEPLFFISRFLIRM